MFLRIRTEIPKLLVKIGNNVTDNYKNGDLATFFA